MIYIYDVKQKKRQNKRTKKEEKDAFVTTKIHTERIKQE